MTWPLLSIVLGLLLLFAGGESLVRGSASLALRLGVTPLLVGLTVVAFGTSSPELVASIKAALDGHGDMAIGNVVGSNIMNIGLILACTAIICPLKVQLQILRFDAPLLILISLVGVWVISDRFVSRLEGFFLTTGLVAYIILTTYFARKAAVPGEVEAEYSGSVPAPRGSIWSDLIFIGVGLVCLAGGSHFLVDGAVRVARLLGMSEAVIGLTIVAAGTSMPELTTCVIAAMKKEADIAIGNIIGSNVFNLLGILGITALIVPLDGSGISMVDLLVMTGFAVALLPMLRSGFVLKRCEGAAFLLAYFGHVFYLWSVSV